MKQNYELSYHTHREKKHADEHKFEMNDLIIKQTTLV